MRDAISTNYSPENDQYGLDQNILRKKIYRNCAVTKLVHDRIFVRELNAIASPPHEEDNSFLGEVIFEDEAFDPKMREEIRIFRNSKIFRCWYKNKYPLCRYKI